MKDFGGESFLILFPIPEVLISIGIDETRIATYDRIWGHIRSILEKTEIGEFFRSLSGAVGDLLLTRFRGGASTGIVERLTSVLKEYSLEGVTPNSPTAYGFHLYLTPKLTPLAFCGKLDSLVHLSSDSSLRPKSLLELIDGTLSEDVVRHLIHQRLPRNWSVLGRAEISKAASRDLLLHNFEGIIIPLCIDHGWCFFCYVNPTRVDVTSPITFINPTGSSARFYTALFLLSKWIPEHESWVPKGVAVERVEVVKSQAACDRDSGIHVVLNAISMAESGKPETRLLDGGVCEALRVKYFVTMLNEMQEAVSKAAEKRKEG
ncbi:hypothetical protein F5Y04DRAFT_262413 [Hypomontagnella monticulosa]|nr:hypothetical protein F5Y04DRAFT_262413 [Hypomontagnella monticulosa]